MTASSLSSTSVKRTNNLPALPLRPADPVKDKLTPKPWKVALQQVEPAPQSSTFKHGEGMLDSQEGAMRHPSSI